MFAEDEYMSRKRVRSLLCLPLLKQAELIGVLYLENSLVSHVFTPARIAVLRLLASQAAVALQNARLYRDVAEREAKIRRLVDANIIGIFISSRMGEIIEANDAFLKMVGYDREDPAAGNMRLTGLTPPEWRASTRALDGMGTTEAVQPYESEYVRKDGSRVPVLIGSAAFDQRRDQGVAFVLDLTERKRAEAEARESERRYREVQMELAHANRVATMGQLSASIAHEITQPIGSARNNARAALNFLDRSPPDLDEVREALGCIVGDADRAGGIIERIRDQIKKAPPRNDRFDLNQVIEEVIGLAQSVITESGVSVQTRLASGMAPVHGDRVQLQQVVLNLILNAVEAMSLVEAGERELLIGTEQSQENSTLVAVRDSGPGIDPERLEGVFEAFYTTKSGGLGMGLSICRSIIETHGGRLWAEANEPRGAVFRFTLPGAEGEFMSSLQSVHRT
jgi:PAS domain S-box-containing protein